MTISSALMIYWPLLTFTVGGIISVVTIWVKLTNKVTALETDFDNKVNLLKGDGAERDKEISELKGRVNTMQPTLGTIQTDIAVIKNTLEFIKGTVSKPPQVTNNL